MHLTAQEAKSLGLANTRRGTKRSKRSAVTVDSHAAFYALCHEHGLPKPLPEFKFAPLRGWKFDWLFVHPYTKGPCVALEIEGGIFGTGKPCPVCNRRRGGGHSSVAGLLRDIEKYNEAAILGYRVIRCLPNEIVDGSIFPVLRRALGMTT